MSKPKTTAKKPAEQPLLTCTVIKHGAKIRRMICGRGKSIKLPADEAKALADAGILRIG